MFSRILRGFGQKSAESTAKKFHVNMTLNNMMLKFNSLIKSTTMSEDQKNALLYLGKVVNTLKLDMDARFDHMDARVDKGFDQLKLDMDARFDHVDTEMHKGFNQFKWDMDVRFDQFNYRLADLLGENERENGSDRGVSVELEKAMFARAQLLWPKQQFLTNYKQMVVSKTGNKYPVGELDIVSFDKPLRIIETTFCLREEDLLRFDDKRGLFAEEKEIEESEISCEFWALYVDADEKDELLKLAQKISVKVVLCEELINGFLKKFNY